MADVYVDAVNGKFEGDGTINDPTILLDIADEFMATASDTIFSIAPNQTPLRTPLEFTQDITYRPETSTEKWFKTAATDESETTGTGWIDTNTVANGQVVTDNGWAGFGTAPILNAVSNLYGTNCLEFQASQINGWRRSQNWTIDRLAQVIIVYQAQNTGDLTYAIYHQPDVGNEFFWNDTTELWVDSGGTSTTYVDLPATPAGKYGVFISNPIPASGLDNDGVQRIEIRSDNTFAQPVTFVQRAHVTYLPDWVVGTGGVRSTYWIRPSGVQRTGMGDHTGREAPYLFKCTKSDWDDQGFKALRQVPNLTPGVPTPPINRGI